MESDMQANKINEVEQASVCMETACYIYQLCGLDMPADLDNDKAPVRVSYDSITISQAACEILVKVLAEIESFRNLSESIHG
jgi:hypothetical protein